VFTVLLAPQGIVLGLANLVGRVLFFKQKRSAS